MCFVCQALFGCGWCGWRSGRGADSSRRLVPVRHNAAEGFRAVAGVRRRRRPRPLLGVGASRRLRGQTGAPNGSGPGDRSRPPPPPRIPHVVQLEQLQREVIARAPYLSKAERERVLQALRVAHAAHWGQVRKSGEPFITHPVAVMGILADMRMDVDTLIAGLLHDAVEDTEVTFEVIERLFGHDVRNIVESETKVSKIARKMTPSMSPHHALFQGAFGSPASVLAAAASATVAAANAAAAAVRNTVGLNIPRTDHDLNGGDDDAAVDAHHPNGRVKSKKPESSSSSSQALSKEEQQAEYIRRMFVSMAEDVRVIIVKLADRLHNMRTLEFMSPSKQVNIARETMDIFAPLARRLGIARIARELEDLSLRYLYPSEYECLQEEVRIFREKSGIESCLAQATSMLERALSQDAVVRPMVRSIRAEPAMKNMCAIFSKVSAGARLENIYDLAAVRLVVDLEEDYRDAFYERNICYHVLGRVHSLFKPVPGHVKDFVAFPKPNGYQSLHTLVVLGPKCGFSPLEVQIFTESMYQLAEYGVAVEVSPENRQTARERSAGTAAASNGRVGDGGGGGDNSTQHFRYHTTDWLRTIREYCREFSGNSKACVNAVQQDLLGNRVYVFTPKNYVLDLPRGSTVVDAAYHIHSDVGNQMIGAKVAGRFVPLDYELSNADSIKIVTSPAAPGPSKEWLRYARSRTARQKIRRFLRARALREQAERGRALLLEAAERLELSVAEVPPDAQIEQHLSRLVPRVFRGDGARQLTSATALLAAVARAGGIGAAAAIVAYFHPPMDPDALRRLGAAAKALEPIEPDSFTDDDEAVDTDAAEAVMSSSPGAVATAGGSRGERARGDDAPIASRDAGLGRGPSRSALTYAQCCVATCCNPVPGDQVVAVRSRAAEDGAPALYELHRTRCLRCLTCLRADPDACIGVSWRAPVSAYPTRVLVLARDGPGLLSRVSGLITAGNISIVASSSSVLDDVASLCFEVSVHGKQDIENLRQRLLQDPAVREVCRVCDKNRSVVEYLPPAHRGRAMMLQPGEVELLAITGSLLTEEIDDDDDDDDERQREPEDIDKEGEDEEDADQGVFDHDTRGVYTGAWTVPEPQRDTPDDRPA